MVAVTLHCQFDMEIGACHVKLSILLARASTLAFNIPTLQNTARACYSLSSWGQCGAFQFPPKKYNPLLISKLSTPSILSNSVTMMKFPYG